MSNPKRCTGCQRVKEGRSNIYPTSHAGNSYKAPRGKVKDANAPIVIAAPVVKEIQPDASDKRLLDSYAKHRDLDVAARAVGTTARPNTMMTSIEIRNPSATHPLKISAQTRRQAPIEDPAAAPPRSPYAQMTPTEHAALTVRGSEMVTRSAFNQMANADREFTSTRWEAAGMSSLAEWITKEWSKSKAVTAPAPRGVRIADDWTASVPFETVAPHGRITLRLDDHRRYVLESREPNATLQISNPSGAHTLALRLRDKAGKTPNTHFLPPGQYGTLALGEHGGVLEQMHYGKQRKGSADKTVVTKEDTHKKAAHSIYQKASDAAFRSVTVSTPSVMKRLPSGKAMDLRQTIESALLAALQKHGQSVYGTIVSVRPHGDLTQIAGFYRLPHVAADIAAAVQAKLCEDQHDPDR